MNAYRKELLKQHRQPDWDESHGCFTVARLVKRFKARVIVEVGVSHGHTAAEVLKNDDVMRYYMVDPWKDKEELYKKVYDSFHLGRSHILRTGSLAASKVFPPKTIDLIYIDAGHSFQSTKRDIKAWYKKLQPGGVLVGDGFEHPKHNWHGVKRAVLQIFKPEEVNRNLGPDSNYWIVKE